MKQYTSIKLVFTSRELLMAVEESLDTQDDAGASQVVLVISSPHTNCSFRTYRSVK